MSTPGLVGRQVGVMINPAAGRGRGALTGDRAVKRLAALGHEVLRYEQPDLAGCVAAVRQALQVNSDNALDALVVVGGDGAVNLAVNLLAGTTVPLGIVPSGTGNDIARSMGLPGDPIAAVDAIDACLRSATTWDVDVIAVTPGQQPPDAAVDLTATRCYFAGVMATGFDAAVSERANRWTWPTGPARYNLAIARELPFYRARSYRLELDGEVWEQDALLVSIANTASYGGGMRIAPDASVSDGLLDIVVVRPLSTPRFVRLFPKVYAGTHVDLADVEVRRAKRVTIATTDRRRPVITYADGERFAALPLSVEVRPGALPVLTASVPGRPTPTGAQPGRPVP